MHLHRLSPGCVTRQSGRHFPGGPLQHKVIYTARMNRRQALSFLNEFADPLLKFVASAPEGGERLTFASGIYRIVDTPMQSPGGAGKDGTSPIRVIAYRNYVIEFISEKLVDGL